MRTVRALILALLLAPLLQGCLAVGAAALATDVAIGTVGTAVGAAGAVGGAAVDVVTPGKDDDEDED
ncbi:hypothetical protein [Maricaulis sp.]|jgi:hypothetical protein|uniref:hypothetical protein n=1 Tax=Maricaulis sp. TaxID=1486257 RepID=UPI002632F387|nr:hypothetical protein [Maricaulis sp.]